MLLISCPNFASNYTQAIINVIIILIKYYQNSKLNEWKTLFSKTIFMQIGSAGQIGSVMVLLKKVIKIIPFVAN